MPSPKIVLPSKQRAAEVTEEAANAAGVVNDAVTIKKLWALEQLKKAYGPYAAGAIKKVKGNLALDFMLAAIEGSAKSIEDMDNGEREKFMMETFGRMPDSVAEDLGADTVRVLNNVINAATYDYPEKIGSRLGSTLYDMVNE